jgi:hypothetical protein
LSEYLHAYMVESSSDGVLLTIGHRVNRIRRR